ncbi:MAG: hypothetical protein Q9218_005132 [Villophora microphyllina]
MKTYDFPDTSGLLSTAPATFAFIALFLVIVTALPTGNLWAKAARKEPVNPKDVETDCPYEYILGIYGKHHFDELVKKLAPKLEASNPQKYQTILDIMDAVHLCLILIDDITDNSNLRKGLPTAHSIFGASETSLRAYLSLVRTVNETMRIQPQLVPAVVSNLEDILTGQDMSLIWRRDGLESLPAEQDDRVKNDCKNIYSNDYAKAKGALAEDLRNGEFSFPIVLALGQPNGRIVERALKNRRKANVEEALRIVRSDSVKGKCLTELKQVGDSIGDFVELWGRKESME